MTSKSLLALAVAGVFCTTSAFAGGVHHSAEVKTPSTVSESAPWLAGQPHLAGWTAPDSLQLSMSHELSGDAFVGTTSGASGFGSVGSDSTASAEMTDYWMIGSQSEESGVGASSSIGASGSVGFDYTTSGSESQRFLHDSSSWNTSTSGDEIVVYTPTAEMILGSVGEETPLLSEHYLVTGPLSSPDSSYLVLAIGPTAEDVALLNALKDDFWIVTPTYAEV